MNVRLAAQQYTGNVIRRLLFNKRYFGKGSEDGGPGFEEIEHVHFLFELPKFLFSFSISDYVPLLREFDLDGHKKSMKMAVSILSKYQDPIIEERIQQWKNGKKTDEEDLLDVIINLKDANNKPLMTAVEIKSQIMVTLFFHASLILLLLHVCTHSHTHCTILLLVVINTYTILRKVGSAVPT